MAFASFDRSIYLLEASTGRKLGEWPTEEICYTTPLIVGNKLFCGSGDKYFYVIDLDKMAIVKRLNMGTRVYSSPRRIGDRIIFGTNGGRVLEMDIETLEIVGTLQLPDAVTNAIAISADEKTIIVSTAMNQLAAFERL